MFGCRHCSPRQTVAPQLLDDLFGWCLTCGSHSSFQLILTPRLRQRHNLGVAICGRHPNMPLKEKAYHFKLQSDSNSSVSLSSWLWLSSIFIIVCKFNSFCGHPSCYLLLHRDFCRDVVLMDWSAKLQMQCIYYRSIMQSMYSYHLTATDNRQVYQGYVLNFSCFPRFSRERKTMQLFSIYYW